MKREQHMRPIIRYAQCWEDPGPLVRYLNIGPEDDVLSIASGGENTFALLLGNPRSIWAVDRNPAQIFLVELKIRAIQLLEYQDFVEFLGVRPCKQRPDLYRRIRANLSEDARLFWDSHPTEINDGVIHCGKFEIYLRLFRSLVVPFVHDRTRVTDLLERRSPEEQSRFYKTTWNSRGWRALFRLVFGRHLLGGLGRGHSTFRYVKVASVADELLRRTEHGFTHVPLYDNFFVEFILRGSYGDLENSHPYLNKSNFEYLKEHAGRIHLVSSPIDASLARITQCKFSKVNASDIFEYMSIPEFDRTLRSIGDLCRHDATLAFWTLFVPREKTDGLEGMFSIQHSQRCIESSDIKTFFYDSFSVWRVNPGEREELATKGQREART